MCIPTAMRYPMWTWCTCAAIILATRIASREEVNRLRWFAPQDMPPMAEIMPPNRPALRQYLESVGVSALT